RRALDELTVGDGHGRPHAGPSAAPVWGTQPEPPPAAGERAAAPAMGERSASPPRAGTPPEAPPSAAEIRPEAHTHAPAPPGATPPAGAAALGAERAALPPRLAAARASRTGQPDDPRERRREQLDALRRELDLPAHDLRHAWRAGLSPDALLRQRSEDP